MDIIFTLLIIAATVSIFLAAFAWTRRPSVSAASFALLMLAIALWCIGVFFGLSAPALATKLVWAKFVFLSIVTVPGALFIFILEYTGQRQWITARNVILLALEPLLILILAWTNEAHGLIYTHTRLVLINNFPMVEATFGAFAWVHTLYSYSLVLVSTLLLIWNFFRLPGIYKSQAAILLLGISVPWISNIISIAELSPMPRLDLTPLAFTVAGVMFAWGLFRFRLLDLVPVARDLVIETMTDGLIVLDARDRVVDVNPPIANVIGLPAQKIIGQPVDQVFARWRDLVNAFRDVSSTQTQVAIGDGATRQLLDLRISPLLDPRGHVLGRAIIVRDISARELVEQELQRAKESAEAANRAKTGFLTSVGHELRAPLRTITGYSDTLLAEATEQGLKTFPGYLEQISQAGRHLLAITDSILNLSKIESGTMPLTLRVFDFAGVLREATRAAQPLAERANNRITLQGAENIGGMYGDKEKIRYTLNGLLDNACRFTRQGQITISAAREMRDGAEWYRVSVSDTGAGMTPAQLARVFEPFTQADPTIIREHGTTGLTLAIGRRYCAMLGGALAATSEPGKGSTFTLQLPVRVNTK